MFTFQRDQTCIIKEYFHCNSCMNISDSAEKGSDMFETIMIRLGEEKSDKLGKGRSNSVSCNFRVIGQCKYRQCSRKFSHQE